MAILDSVADHPRLSTRRRSANLGIPRTTLQRILRTELKLYPYRWTVHHTLQPQDPPVRVRFADWFLPEEIKFVKASEQNDINKQEVLSMIVLIS